MKRVELLAPAGDLEKLKYAIIYGADAVYIGGQVFGLRAAAKNFSFEDMKEGITFAHERGKKVFLVLNIIPHNEDIHYLEKYIEEIKDLGLDAVILSDPGTFMFVKQYAPDLEVHLSTQANNTNFMSANFWHNQGVKRVILARELSFDEISEIRAKTPPALELESFIHGAMCISYSGRCLMSNYMAGRDANRGACAQPCRWEYNLVEKTRPGEYFPVEETEDGTFFFNSKDLCMIEQIPDLIRSGLDSLKIEGRMKTIYYVASIVRAYRKAIDEFYKDPEGYVYDPKWYEELQKVSHREFTNGFYNQKPTNEDQLYTTSSYIRTYDFIGVVQSYDIKTGIATIEQRNHFRKGDKIEIIGPDYYYSEHVIEDMYDANDNLIEVAPHAKMTVKLPLGQPVKPFYMLRMVARD
ncbi:U32 family peptidase [Fusibacter bizertensis]|jgi:Collagenase and related proteases|uniref:U32 family peptidase n=1 Tax=Fusibacter bizertensis TaxID=1488331 RepID=A0ABT6N9L0_9FIRM|nr:U32 family peptidase [Fusibacter bizertensis]MDH8677090.1 U32 family peptidase [Fusibacter bizertensis]